jgi:hypothetical protein
MNLSTEDTETERDFHIRRRGIIEQNFNAIYKCSTLLHFSVSSVAKNFCVFVFLTFDFALLV